MAVPAHIDGEAVLQRQSSARRSGAIDMLRGLSILWVVSYHYYYRFNDMYFPDAPNVPAFSFGYLGVSAFYILSAYCILGSLVRSPGASNFLVKRVSRLMPAYLIGVVATFLIVSIFHLPGREVSLAVALGNLLWINMAVPIGHVDGVYWTLAIELKFYAILAGLYFASGRNFDRLLWGWRAVCLVGLFFSLIGRGGVLETISSNILLFPYSPYFLLGLMAYSWTRTNHWDKALDAVIVLLAIAISSSVPATFVSLVVSVACVALIRMPHVPSLAPLVFVGACSYPLYLLHQNVGLVIMRQAQAVGIEWLSRGVIALGATLAMSALIAYKLEPMLRPLVERAISGMPSFRSMKIGNQS